MGSFGQAIPRTLFFRPRRRRRSGAAVAAWFVFASQVLAIVLVALAIAQIVGLFV